MTFVRDHPKLEETYQKYFNTFGFAPVINEKSLKDTSDYILVEEEKIVASLSLVDVNIHKQNVIIDMPRYLKSLVRITKLFHKMPFVPNLPGKGEPILILYIKYFYCEVGYEKSAQKLIKHCLTIAKKKKYHFLTIGIHERDPMIRILKGFPKIEFKSEGYFSSLKGSDKTDKILNTKIYEDYSLV